MVALLIHKQIKPYKRTPITSIGLHFQQGFLPKDSIPHTTTPIAERISLAEGNQALRRFLGRRVSAKKIPPKKDDMTKVR